MLYLCSDPVRAVRAAGPLAPISPPRLKAYIKDSAATTVLTDVTVFDGTGGQPEMHQTIVITDGLISQMGKTGEVKLPANATVINGTGKTVIPGLVMLHEHYTIPCPWIIISMWPEMPFFLPTDVPGSGVTTSRTAGSIEPQTDSALRRMIGEGKVMGPDMDVTAPYIERAGFDIPSINIIRIR